jgi:hypothetical protein
MRRWRSLQTGLLAQNASDLLDRLRMPPAERPDLATSLDSNGSMWALEYCTTPSLPCVTRPSVSTAMIEFTVTSDATVMFSRAWMKLLCGDMLSMAEGTNGLRAAPGFLAMSRAWLATGNGGSSSNRTASSIIVRPATKLPRCTTPVSSGRPPRRWVSASPYVTPMSSASRSGSVLSAADSPS